MSTIATQGARIQPNLGCSTEQIQRTVYKHQSLSYVRHEPSNRQQKEKETKDYEISFQNEWNEHKQRKHTIQTNICRTCIKVNKNMVIMFLIILGHRKSKVHCVMVIFQGVHLFNPVHLFCSPLQWSNGKLQVPGGISGVRL